MKINIFDSVLINLPSKYITKNKQNNNNEWMNANNDNMII